MEQIPRGVVHAIHGIEVGHELLGLPVRKRDHTPATACAIVADPMRGIAVGDGRHIGGNAGMAREIRELQQLSAMLQALVQPEHHSLHGRALLIVLDFLHVHDVIVADVVVYVERSGEAIWRRRGRRVELPAPFRCRNGIGGFKEIQPVLVDVAVVGAYYHAPCRCAD